MRLSAFTILLAGIPRFSVAAPAGYARPQVRELPRAPSKHLRPVLEKRQQFTQRKPINAAGKGGPILGTWPLIHCDDDDYNVYNHKAGN